MSTVHCTRATAFLFSFLFLVLQQALAWCFRPPSISSLGCLRDAKGFPSALLTWSLPPSQSYIKKKKGARRWQLRHVVWCGNPPSLFSQAIAGSCKGHLFLIVGDYSCVRVAAIAVCCAHGILLRVICTVRPNDYLGVVCCI